MVTIETDDAILPGENASLNAEDTAGASMFYITAKYGGLLAVAAAIWLNLVNLEVHGAYLDEEFHIRQALVYAENRFSVWDPKITTPPGLYIVAYGWLYLLRTIHTPGSPEAHLRSLNTVGLVGLWYVAWCLSDAIQSERQPKIQRKDAKFTSKPDPALEALVLSKRHQTTAHVALNVAAFPLLFFFGALFYTDVLSALFVLLAHLAYYRRNAFGVLVASLVSLTFRQTNIFWTAIYLGGLEARWQLLRLDTARHGRRKPAGALSWSEVVKMSCYKGTLYDTDAPGASVEDYLKSGVSLALAALANLPSLLLPLTPYLLLIAAFTAFVIFNGGVVLGDKSNHVASLHIPQLLYIWPAFIFFSFTLFATSALLVVAATLQKLYPSMVTDGSWNIPDAVRMPRLLPLLAFTTIALLAVHFNTIVHPFILADNRHYTFYVFRLLLRHPLIKYGVTPVYVACGWLCLSLGLTGYEARQQTGTQDLKTSVALIWLLTTVGTLATAPLVEPRYFILPWIIWRLNLHVPPLIDLAEWDSNQKNIISIERETLGYETNWSIIVNLAVMYMFLFWRFEWPQQPGSMMRFMW